MGKQYSTLTRMALFALAGLFVSIQTGRAADDCLTKPNATAPPGNHWYYRLDRTTHRECWYLAPEGREVRTSAHPDGSPAQSHPSNTMSAQPTSQTHTPAETAEVPGAEPLAAEPVLVKIAPDQTKTAEATRVGPLAAEPVPVDTAPTQAKTVAAAAPLGSEELAPDEIAPSQAKTTEIDSTASAIRGSAKSSTSNLSIDPMLVPTRDGYAEGQSVARSESELRPVELSATQQGSEYFISFAQLTAVFAIWLGLAALIVPILFKPSAIDQRAHQKAHDRRNTSIRRGKRRSPFKGAKTPPDPTPDFESSVRLLLQEFQRQQRRSRLPADRKLGAKVRFAPI
jgi:hypothetical protein